MGEARRRGTLEQRVAQAVIRRQEEDARRSEERARIAAEQRRLASERQARLSTHERKEAVMVADGGSRGRNLSLIAALAMSLPPGRKP